MEINQRMLKSDGQVASEITLKVGLMDLEKRKLIAPTKEWLKAIECWLASNVDYKALVNFINFIDDNLFKSKILNAV